MSTTRILDGGMSRELLRLGAELKQPEWSALALMNSPEIVREVHQEFIAAGSEIITTNSYALVPFHIGEHRFRQEGPALIRLAGRLAREAAEGVTGRKVQVAGSLPPIFGSYEPQNFQPAQVQDYLEVLVENLAPFVDLWLGETLSLIAEGEAVRKAVAASGKPFWISFTLADDEAALRGGAPKLRSGESVEDAASWAVSSGAAAFLFNCSKPEVMRGAVDTAARVFRERNAQIEIGVYANAFEGETGEQAANEGLHGTRDDLDDDAYSRFACSWAEAGATIIGGCCGIGAAHIHRLTKTLSR
ncbi:homocysteine S-methyltransferase family protein [Rhizobium bangladeshense]|uniref:Homocysteine S-methyltransferase family protein n=1 Tax=Rhizobium bangladeshense TaxID=1138189 RepID=A0ABS7LNA3_9HYPH|nr:homocysteine S-methyltransferase family protein [Rhizobium bangladeshense]MBX4869946.1 homocysteine S-methyltransferase family protein [Rhizobium bangladeshense]MBX4886269.1 homocysteine S-methyltransferase family protein [Rhizobium bangladeshense]MBX4904855.1 homocysteine S-methyltransferase family protein [Rhizobium bangladeshense]MBY3592780.1 homocysteine S-methyltransferase family protein [Rhizobium bangladeshense]MBY3614481.1 homocysteine S-methyltransferase family protein [Rhizobium b